MQDSSKLGGKSGRLRRQVGPARQGRQIRARKACEGQADVGGQAREAGMKESRQASRKGREVNLGHVRRQGRHSSK
jgi:hypothetical protein